MSGNGLNQEGFLAARDTIAALKGTVECLQVNLSGEGCQRRTEPYH